jgi:hypothetical protein
MRRSIQLFQLLLLLVLFGMTAPAFAQVDFSGVWGPFRPYEEDEPERGPGPALVDFVGLPISDHGRQWGLA